MPHPRASTTLACSSGCWAGMTKQESTLIGWSSSRMVLERWVLTFLVWCALCGTLCVGSWGGRFVFLYNLSSLKYGFFPLQGLLLKAWINVTSGQDMYAKKAGKLFDEGLKDKADVFGLMGKVRYKRATKVQVLVSWVTFDCCLFHPRHNIMNIARTTREH